MFKTLGGPLGSSGGGVLATCAMEKAKKRNIKVPANSDRNAVTWLRGLSGRNPMTASVLRKPTRGLIGILEGREVGLLVYWRKELYKLDRIVHENKRNTDLSLRKGCEQAGD